MINSEQCPVCGGKTTVKEVTEIISGGNDTVTIKLETEVCLHCGEHLYLPENMLLFEDIKSKLERQETDKFTPVGQSFILV